MSCVYVLGLGVSVFTVCVLKGGGGARGGQERSVFPCGSSQSSASKQKKALLVAFLILRASRSRLVSFLHSAQPSQSGTRPVRPRATDGGNRQRLLGIRRTGLATLVRRCVLSFFASLCPFLRLLPRTWCTLLWPILPCGILGSSNGLVLAFQIRCLPYSIRVVHRAGDSRESVTSSKGTVNPDFFRRSLLR